MPHSIRREKISSLLEANSVNADQSTRKSSFDAVVMDVITRLSD